MIIERLERVAFIPYYGGITRRVVSIFSLFRIVKEQYLKRDPEASFEILRGDTFHLSPSKWRPLGDSNPCCRRERAES